MTETVNHTYKILTNVGIINNLISQKFHILILPIKKGFELSVCKPTQFKAFAGSDIEAILLRAYLWVTEKGEESYNEDF